VDLGREKGINMVVITESSANVSAYRVEVFCSGVWKQVVVGDQGGRVKIHRFGTVYGDKVRVLFDGFAGAPAIAEVGVYCERR
jgi:alpha-L-fucosidase